MIVVIHGPSSNALDSIATVCNIEAACICNTTDVSCSKFVQEPPFVFPNDTKILRFVDVPIDTLNQNSITNGKQLQNITWISSKIKFVQVLYYNDLVYLDLSRNNINQLVGETFNNCPRLQYIDLSHNQIGVLEDNLFSSVKMLETMKLDNNIFDSISENVFKEVALLKHLSIGNSNLKSIAKSSMSNLDKLEYLSIENSQIDNLETCCPHENLRTIILNNCTNLKSIDKDFIYSAPNIELIELNKCSIKFLPPNIVSLKNLKYIKMVETEIQPNCHNGWFGKWFNETNIVIGYDKYKDFIEILNKINCPPNIYHTSESITFQLTHKGIIDCMTYGNPPPAITWLVPGGLTFHENKEADTNISHHPNIHNWDLNQVNSPILLSHKNGSLEILRMLRANIGNYTCVASNQYGNDSKTVKVHLDSGVFFNIKINALLLGISSALGFLVLTILCCALKLFLTRLVNYCLFCCTYISF